MSDILHIQECANQAADALLRVQAVSQIPTPAIDFEYIAIAQRDDPELSRLKTTANSLELRDISLLGSANLLTCGTSTGTLQPVAPAQF